MTLIDIEEHEILAQGLGYSRETAVAALNRHLREEYEQLNEGLTEEDLRDVPDHKDFDPSEVNLGAILDTAIGFGEVFWYTHCAAIL